MLARKSLVNERFTHPIAHLRGNDYFLTTLPQRSPKHHLRLPIGISISGIEKIDSFIKRSCYEFVCTSLIDLVHRAKCARTFAKGHAAKGKLGDDKTCIAQLCILHDITSFLIILALRRSPGTEQQSALPVPGHLSCVHPSTPPCRLDTVAGFGVDGFPPRLFRRAPYTTLFAPLRLRHLVPTAPVFCACRRGKGHKRAGTQAPPLSGRSVRYSVYGRCSHHGESGQ